MNASLSKKEIRHHLEAALINEIEKMKGTGSSKKMKRAVRKVSKDIALKLKHDLKKMTRKESKRSKMQNDINGYALAPAEENNKNRQ